MTFKCSPGPRKPARVEVFQAADSISRDCCHRRFSPTVTPLRFSDIRTKRGPWPLAMSRCPVLSEKLLRVHQSRNDITWSALRDRLDRGIVCKLLHAIDVQVMPYDPQSKKVAAD